MQRLAATSEGALEIEFEGLSASLPTDRDEKG